MIAPRITEELLSMPPEQRAELADMLLRSLRPDEDPAISHSQTALA